MRWSTSGSSKGTAIALASNNLQRREAKGGWFQLVPDDARPIPSRARRREEPKVDRLGGGFPTAFFRVRFPLVDFEARFRLTLDVLPDENPSKTRVGG